MITIANPRDCCGCTACASICAHNAIIMQPDAFGFLYPKVVELSCVDCGQCEKVCPIIKRKNKTYNTEPREWLAARHHNNKILFESTSGGVSSALINEVLENNGVIYGVSYNDNMEVVHSSAETKEDCMKFVGSKYVQSNIIGVFPQIREQLQEGKKTLFIGTPCQVEGLKSFLRKDYENLLTVDIICHAVSSPKVFSDYIHYVEQKIGRKLNNIKMRDKQKKGWGHSTSTRYIFNDGVTMIDPRGLIDWNSIYFSGLIDRPSCGECQFCNINRPGDLTIGDFWDDNNKRPDLYDRNGTSLVLVNTEKGYNMVHGNKNLSCWIVKMEEAMQYNLHCSTIPNAKADYFRIDYINTGFRPTIKKYIINPRLGFFRRELLFLKRLIYRK